MQFLDIVEHSFYLKKLTQQHAEFASLLTQKTCQHLMQQELESLKQISAVQDCDTGHLYQQLLHIKQRYTLAWVYAQHVQLIDFITAGESWTQLAQVCIHQALRYAQYQPSIKQYLSDTTKDEEDNICGLFILGLGKLGGYDLNFSSDVDLIAFYDKTTIGISTRYGQRHIVSKLLSIVIKILQPLNKEAVWRVDWRLRPNASDRYLCHSTDFAEEFYFFKAQPWHRLAMIKARPIAGDISLGYEFLEQITPFLWHKNLDYRELDEIASLKEKINLEHPSLKKQRESNQELTISSNIEFNLKLGHGGIREIEFIVNAMQMLWGGKQVLLRNTCTLKNLKHLESLQLLDKNVCSQLTHAYILLRQIENAIQLLDNQQTHNMPRDEKLCNSIAALCHMQWDEMNSALLEARTFVHNEFKHFFEAHNNSAKNAQETISNKILSKSISKLNEETRLIYQQWQDGFEIYGITKSQKRRLLGFSQVLMGEIINTGIEINEAILSIHSYFSKLPPGGQYLRLIYEHPFLLAKIILPLLVSPPMKTLLEQSPHIIEQYIARPKDIREMLNIESDIDYVMFSSDYEARLEKIRRITNENLFNIYLHFLQEQIHADTYRERLTQLAEKIISLCCEVVKQKMNIEDIPIAVIGLGTLGISNMGANSDIDLLYLYDKKHNAQLANQFVSRLNNSINLQMREGRAYELDDRLRPYGKSGSATISIESFERYQLQHAKTWEHLALYPARFIAGDKNTGEAFYNIQQRVLEKSRNTSEFLLDAYDMLRLIRQQRIKKKKEIFNAKLISGGLMETEYFINCVAVLIYRTHALSKNTYRDNLKIIESYLQQPLLKSLDFLQNLQRLVRLFGHEDWDLDKLPDWQKNFIKKYFSLQSITELNTLIIEHTKVSNDCIDYFFKTIELQNYEDWKLQAVRWDD